MIQQYIQKIVDSVLSKVPELKKSIVLAKIDDDGRVLMRDAKQNEYTFAGLSDRDDAYFYIRFRNGGKIEFSPSSIRKVAMMQNFYHVNYNLRLVACLKNADPVCFEENIRFALMNANLISTSTSADVKISLIESTIDPMAVVSDEMPNGKQKPFDKNLVFVAIDFDVEMDRDMSLENYCFNPCSVPSC